MKATAALLDDILAAINAIENYNVLSYESFISDTKTQDAILYNLIILGEAANRIPAQFMEDHPEIPWTSMIGTRNIIVHGYDQVKLLIIWDILQKNLQPLKAQLKSLK